MKDKIAEFKIAAIYLILRLFNHGPSLFEKLQKGDDTLNINFSCVVHEESGEKLQRKLNKRFLYDTNNFIYID